MICIKKVGAPLWGHLFLDTRAMGATGCSKSCDCHRTEHCGTQMVADSSGKHSPGFKEILHPPSP